MTEKLLSQKQVTELTTLSKPSLYRLMKDGLFPPARQLSEKRVGWLQSDVMNWIESRAVITQ